MGNSINNNKMALKEAPQVNRESVTYRQSANVLFNFMPKLDYLIDKLRYKAMIPRYYEETVEYLDLEVIKKIAFPMVCFCDIHLNKLTYHMGDRNSHDGYGRYGIGMNKDWGITGGIQPISYMNDSSALLSDYKRAFTQALQQNNEEKGDAILHNFMLTQLLYIKPLNGSMAKQRETRFEHITKNFHDEREWRFIPNFSGLDTDLELVIPPELMINNTNNSVCNAYSEGIREKRELWLEFEYADIKYLIVDSEDNRRELIRFIIQELLMEDEEKYILISKIIVFTQIEKDW